MNGGKIRLMESQEAAQELAVSVPYRGEAGFRGGTQGMSERAPGWLRKEAAAAWAACGAFERAAFAYFAMSGVLIALFAEHLRHPLRLLGVRAIVACVVLLLCWIQARSAERSRAAGESLAGQWWHFWRHWYPHLFFLFCFEELGQLMTLVTPNWQDAKLIAFDHWMTGVHPSIWLEQFVTPGRNEFMQLAYLTYFVYLLVLGGVLYFRREWHAYWSVMTYSMVGYSAGYIIAMFFPIESPWFSMAGMWKAPLNGGPMTATINFIEHYGRVRGAAFPSEHVAGSIAVLWGAWKFRRWLFWVMAPLVFLMCVSTIWGRYHYIADIFGGIVTGTLGYVIGSWVMERKNAVTTDSAGMISLEREL
jgi:membrane-associated phospholipid phosphatase